MRFWKTVPGKGCHHLPDTLPVSAGTSCSARAPCTNFILERYHTLAGIKVIIARSQQIGIGEQKTGQFMCDA